MAALMDGYIITSLARKSSLLSIDRAQSSNFILITSQNSFINIFNVNDQKIVNSWSVRHGISITSPTTWSSFHNQYLTVFNKQEIRRWSEDEKSIDKAKKKHVKRDIKKILTYKEYEPIVVCENGTVDFIDGIKTTSEQPILDDDTKIVFCQLVPSQSGVKVLYISEAKTTRSVHCHEYSDSNKEWKHTTYSIKYKDNILDYSYYIDNDYNTYIYYIGSNKDLCRIKVNNDNIEEELVTTITEITSSINIVALDSTQLIIAGLHHNDKDGFGIYDMKYSAIQSFQPFPEEYNTQPKIFLVENQIFLSCNRNIYVYNINSRTPTLGEFLGKSMTTEQEDSSLQVISWCVKDDKIKTNKSDELEKLIDFSKTPNHSKFSSVFQSFLRKYSQQGNLTSVSNLHLKKLCQRCLHEKEFWPSEEMKELLEHGLIPLEMTAELITVLIEKEEKKLLNLCLYKLTGISEQSLIQVLQYYLSLSEDDLDEDMILKSISVLQIDNERCPFGKLKAYLIRLVVNSPFSEIFLVNELHRLSFEHVLVLLEFLFYLMSTEDEQAVSYLTVPKIQNVIDWISCIVDAHVTQLILSPDARVLLIKLHQSVSQQAQFFDGIMELEAILSQFKSKLTTPRKAKIGQYCIEVLHIF